MKSKFVYYLPEDNWELPPAWWMRYTGYCEGIAEELGWMPITVINRKLSPYRGRLIIPNTGPSYLIFDAESYFAAFLLKWS